MTILILLAILLNAFIGYLIYDRLGDLMLYSQGNQADLYKQAVQKTRHKPMLPLKKEVVRGRKIEKSDDLVDIADLPWEEGYKAMEDIK